MKDVNDVLQSKLFIFLDRFYPRRYLAFLARNFFEHGRAGTDDGRL